MKAFIKPCFTVFLGLSACTLASAQCLHQVTHVSGTMAINGVQVTVSASGMADTLTYCDGATTPYFAGYEFVSSSSGSGSYLFTFNPPVAGVRLNFGGISNTLVGSEEVRLYLNADHYSLSSPGLAHDCEPLAILTPEGNIRGCVNCPLSGWDSTTISAVISALEVSDTVISGSPAGVVFSLFICDPVTGVPEEGSGFSVAVFNDLANRQLILEGRMLQQARMDIYDLLGRRVVTDIRTEPGRTVLNLAAWERGVYFLRITNSREVSTLKFWVP